jgi:hypothetical protein
MTMANERTKTTARKLELLSLGEARDAFLQYHRIPSGYTLLLFNRRTKRAMNPSKLVWVSPLAPRLIPRMDLVGDRVQELVLSFRDFLADDPLLEYLKVTVVRVAVDGRKAGGKDPIGSTNLSTLCAQSLALAKAQSDAALQSRAYSEIFEMFADDVGGPEEVMKAYIAGLSDMFGKSAVRRVAQAAR